MSNFYLYGTTPDDDPLKQFYEEHNVGYYMDEKQLQAEKVIIEELKAPNIIPEPKSTEIHQCLEELKLSEETIRKSGLDTGDLQLAIADAQAKIKPIDKLVSESEYPETMEILKNAESFAFFRLGAEFEKVNQSYKFEKILKRAVRKETNKRNRSANAHYSRNGYKIKILEIAQKTWSKYPHATPSSLASKLSFYCADKPHAPSEVTIRKWLYAASFRPERHTQRGLEYELQF